jgi:hypothetical protein
MPQNRTAPRALQIARSEPVGLTFPPVSLQNDKDIDEPIERIPVQADTNLILDVSDLVFYIGHHDNLTGIQRVSADFRYRHDRMVIPSAHAG